MLDHEQSVTTGDQKITPESTLDENKQKQIGAKLLANANFHKRHETVESSYQRALSSSEKLAGNNGERRDLSYLNRLEKVVEKGGSETEKRLWRKSIANVHLVQQEDITESTWNSVLQAALSHGYGYEVTSVSDEQKQAMTKQYRDLQIEDLNSFAEYFADEDCPYPLWFKIYAWDGLTNLSRNTKVGKDGFPIFQKRDKSTTSGFPKLNPAALAKMYDGITRYYGLTTNAAEAPYATQKTDTISETLVRSGSFAKIYSYEMSQLSKQVEVPDKTEDVHGEWVEYDTTKSNELSAAAEGTPWCIVSPNVAKNYLLYGSYSHANDKEVDEKSKGRFLLFHLYDKETNELAPNACASIRINPAGEVAEISGILDGPAQNLNRSLLPIVEEKANQLPNGLKVFRHTLDNAELTRLYKITKENDRKFSVEDIDYVFEVERKIKPDVWYHREDDSPIPAKDYRIERIQDFILSNPNSISPSGANRIAEILDEHAVAEHARALLSAHADMDKIVDKLTPLHRIKIIDVLKSRGFNPDDILEEAKKEARDKSYLSFHVEKNIDELLRAGIDPNHVAELLIPSDLGRHVTQLAEAGADINKITDRMRPGDIRRYSEQLTALGVNTKELIDRKSAELKQRWRG